MCCNHADDDSSLHHADDDSSLHHHHSV
jgi:hypothetical protein